MTECPQKAHSPEWNFWDIPLIAAGTLSDALCCQTPRRDFAAEENFRLKNAAKMYPPGYSMNYPYAPDWRLEPPAAATATRPRWVQQQVAPVQTKEAPAALWRKQAVPEPVYYAPYAMPLSVSAPPTPRGYRWGDEETFIQPSREVAAAPQTPKIECRAWAAEPPKPTLNWNWRPPNSNQGYSTAMGGAPAPSQGFHPMGMGGPPAPGQGFHPMGMGGPPVVPGQGYSIEMDACSQPLFPWWIGSGLSREFAAGGLTPDGQSTGWEAFKTEEKEEKIQQKEKKKNPENKNAENKNAENKNAENKNAENKNAENKNLENKNAENKKPENKRPENRNIENKNIENKNLENKNLETKAEQGAKKGLENTEEAAKDKEGKKPEDGENDDNEKSAKDAAEQARKNMWPRKRGNQRKWVPQAKPNQLTEKEHEDTKEEGADPAAKQAGTQQEGSPGAKDETAGEKEKLEEDRKGETAEPEKAGEDAKGASGKDKKTDEKQEKEAAGEKATEGKAAEGKFAEKKAADKKAAEKKAAEEKAAEKKAAEEKAAEEKAADKKAKDSEEGSVSSSDGPTVAEEAEGQRPLEEIAGMKTNAEDEKQDFPPFPVHWFASSFSYSPGPIKTVGVPVSQPQQTLPQQTVLNGGCPVGYVPPADGKFKQLVVGNQVYFEGGTFYLSDTGAYLLGLRD